MIRINRRKLLKLGFGGIFLLPVSNKKSIALDIEVNRFGDNKNINLDNINTVAIKIKKFNIISNNINYNKDVKLKITGKVGETNIGEIKDIDINLQDGETNVKNHLNSDVIKLNNSELFSNDKYRPEKKELEIELKFRLDHSSLENPVTKDVIYTFGISGNGELVQHNFDNRNNKSLSNNSRINEFSDAKMHVFKNLGGDELSQKLIQSGSIINKSSENINSAISDIQQIPFDNNSIDQYPQISNSEPDEMYY